MTDAHKFLETLAVVLCTAGATTVLFQKLRQPVVLGYLLAGILVGPYVPVPINADNKTVQTLSELGVILLMFSLGMEFSLRKLLKVGVTAALIAIVQCSFMLWVGYLAGKAFGWTQLESVYAGAVIAISSTTIIVKAFEEQKVRGDFKELVFGVLIVEDLIAILMLTVLTAVSAGEDLSISALAATAGQLALFLVGTLVIGILTVPRLTRAIIRLDRPETTLVASVGLAFGLASLAAYFHYSVALGAFLAGTLIGESGVQRKVEHLVQPVRDMFAAIFFVSVGMLINPALILENWQAVLVFVVLVVVGMVVSVSAGAVLAGKSVQTAIKTGMSLAQIGEFSFIIAGLGVATGATRDFLYPVAVAVSAVTTLLTPWLIRAAEPVATLVDRKLPRPLQTFVALYGTWLETLGSHAEQDAQRATLKRSAQWLLVDTVVMAAIVVSVSVRHQWLADWVRERLDVSEGTGTLLVVAATVLISSPVWIGMFRAARTLGQQLAERAFPHGDGTVVDSADAPRRLMVVTLQMALVMLVGGPLVAITQPFLPAGRGALLLLLLIALLGLSFWRRATNLQGHTRAAAQVLAAALSEQMHQPNPEQSLDGVNRLLLGLGSPVPIRILPTSAAVGKTLAELNVRGLTGATILTIRRGSDTLLVPAGNDTLIAGDVLALAGRKDAVDAARSLLLDGGEQPAPA